MSRVVSMSQLGKYGRLANQIFEASFLYCYAKMHDLVVQAPKPEGWPFTFSFQPINANLPHREESYITAGDTDNGTHPPSGEEFVNRDFCGYAQWNTSWYAQWKDDLQSWFSIPRSKLGTANQTVVGIHHRAGDYDNKTIKWRTPWSWYERWLNANWSRLKNPILVISSEEEVPEDFKPPVKPIILSGTATEDWADLSHCDIVLCPNSTFSFAAAMMNPNLKEAWRASLPAGSFVRFDPWNATPLLYDKCEKYWQLLGMPEPPPVNNKSRYSVSVVIPCYNHARWLGPAIASAHEQTWPVHEVIVVDDGSTDNSAEIAVKSGARLIQQSNLGPSAARNAGIAAATGNYSLPSPERPEFRDLLRANCLTVSCLYLKAIWEDIGGYDSKLDGVEDWEFWLRALSNGYKVRIIPEVLFYYRHTNADSVSKNHDLRRELVELVRARYE